LTGNGPDRWSGVRFALLGPLLVDDGSGSQVPLSGARLRALLAALLLHANVPVPSEALAEVVWDGAPPPAAAQTLRSYIRRLRHALGPAGTARIAAYSPGYLVRAEPAELDVLQFEAACAEAGAALRERSWATASATATRALTLWRGAPLLDVASQALHAEFAPHLDQLRVQALEDRAEADLHLGLNDSLVPQLRELTAQHPLRERFHAQLMLALARTGRQAEALETYRQARSVLVTELGVEPGPGLQQLHARILRGDAELSVSAPTGPPASPGTMADEAGTGSSGAWTTLVRSVNALAVSDHVEFLAELHRRFHDRVMTACVIATLGSLPGRQRVTSWTIAYLDACRQEPGVRNMLASARSESAIRAAVKESNEHMSELITPDFAEMGRARPAQTALIWVGMAAEVALAETAAAAELPDLRAALIDFLGP
jgi:DNA-binding SARP family transcriptional activator